MLATVRIGAIHSVVFGGFASASLATRIDDAKPTVIVSADAGMRMGKWCRTNRCSTRPSISQAQARPRCCCSTVASSRCRPTPGRDIDWAGFRASHMMKTVPVEWVESSHRATSSTPAAPPASRRACSAIPAVTRWR